jgi:hypothetical protein
MLLEKNGLASASKQSRHMNIQYFFIVDWAKNGELRIEYCLTDKMIGDFFTKPLQGAQFYILHDDIMNVDPCSAYHSAHRSVLSPDSRHNDDRPRDNNNDITSTDASKEDDVSMRKSYLEAVLQWADFLTLCDLLVKLVQSTLFDLLVSVCLHWMTVASTRRRWPWWLNGQMMVARLHLDNVYKKCKVTTKKWNEVNFAQFSEN